MTDPSVPPIPLWLSHLPTLGGLAIPWNTLRADDGRYLFGGIDSGRTARALRERLCGVCGLPLVHPMVLLMRLSDLPRHGTVEPALHPQCANYTAAACPMVAGRLRTYRATPIRLDYTMARADDTPARLGAPADPWFAVWLRNYQVASIGGHLAASYAGTEPLRIRPITWRYPNVLA